MNSFTRAALITSIVAIAGLATATSASAAPHGPKGAKFGKKAQVTYAKPAPGKHGKVGKQAGWKKSGPAAKHGHGPAYESPPPKFVPKPRPRPRPVVVAPKKPAWAFSVPRITMAEMRRINAQRLKLERLERRYQRDGFLTAAERRVLALNRAKLERMIRVALWS